VKYKIIAGVVALLAFVGFGSTAAFAAGSVAADPTPAPVLAQTGTDFTPMLITAAVLLLVSGVAVVVAKYTLSRAGRSAR
jgi:dihydroxyacetone kinase